MYRATRPDTRPKSFPATRSTATVFVVDDDVSIRESLELLIAQAGWRPALFGSAQEFLASPHRASPSCLLLDVGLPDLNGLELQQRIAAERTYLPIIFITGYCNVPMTVQAMKAGAMDVMTKPFAPELLLEAIHSALEHSRLRGDEAASLQGIQARYGSLSRREREVMALVVRGRLNKQIGGLLDISEITVKAHRGSVMRKMQVKSLPELVTVASRLGVEVAGAS